MTPWVRRLLAAALLVGGCVGIGMLVANAATLLGHGGIVVVLTVGWVALFGAAAVAGVMLWRDAPGAHGFALGLYALQVPVLVSSPLYWTWFTGIQVAVQLAGAGSDFNLTLNLHFGASGQFFLGSRVAVAAFGVNLFALAAVVVLLRARRRPSGGPDGERRASVAQVRDRVRP